MINRIKRELAKRLSESESGFIEIRMKKSSDVVIITAHGDIADPNTMFEIKSFKLQAVFAFGLDNLACEIANYDQTVADQQKLIGDLYAFKREKIDTKQATDTELFEYVETYNKLFGYRPSVGAA